MVCSFVWISLRVAHMLRSVRSCGTDCDFLERIWDRVTGKLLSSIPVVELLY